MSGCTVNALFEGLLQTCIQTRIENMYYFFYKYKLYISDYTDSLSVVNRHNILTEINKYYTVGEDVLMHLMIFRS